MVALDSPLPRISPSQAVQVRHLPHETAAFRVGREGRIADSPRAVTSQEVPFGICKPRRRRQLKRRAWSGRLRLSQYEASRRRGRAGREDRAGCDGRGTHAGARGCRSGGGGGGGRLRWRGGILGGAAVRTLPKLHQLEVRPAEVPRAQEEVCRTQVSKSGRQTGPVYGKGLPSFDGQMAYGRFGTWRRPLRSCPPQRQRRGRATQRRAIVPRKAPSAPRRCACATTKRIADRLGASPPTPRPSSPRESRAIAATLWRREQPSGPGPDRLGAIDSMHLGREDRRLPSRRAFLGWRNSASGARARESE